MDIGYLINTCTQHNVLLHIALTACPRLLIVQFLLIKAGRLSLIIRGSLPAFFHFAAFSSASPKAKLPAAVRESKVVRAPT